VTDRERIETIWQCFALLDERWCTQTQWELSGAPIEAAKSRATKSMERLLRLERSLSWRMTVPLRNLAFSLRRLSMARASLLGGQPLYSGQRKWQRHTPTAAETGLKFGTSQLICLLARFHKLVASQSYEETQDDGAHI
jgi:hypothetical protein